MTTLSFIFISKKKVQEIKEEEYDNLGLDDDDAKVFLHRLVYSPSE